MSNARAYKPSHIKKLFALSGNQCAMPDCIRQIVSTDKGIVLGKICHIVAAGENGPRNNKDLKLSIDQLRHFSNLVLMCSDHHDEIDNEENLKKYTIEFLKDLKEEHESINIYTPFVLEKQHLENLQEQLEQVAAVMFDTHIIVKKSSEVVSRIEQKVDSSAQQIVELTAKFDSIYQLMGQNSNNSFISTETDALVEAAIHSKYDWVDSERILEFEEALSNYNSSISDKREKFLFNQRIIQSMFNVSDLNRIILIWDENWDSTENLPHLEFIQGGIMAYQCLQQIPDDLIEDMRLADWSPLHRYYYDGYLGSFVEEIKRGMALKLDLIERYRSDRYLFENLTRIFNSVRRFLEYDVNDLYWEKAEATIIKKLPSQFLLLGTSKELSLRNENELSMVYARLPLDPQFQIIKTLIVQTIEETLIIGCNSKECFVWNPCNDISAQLIYKVKKKEFIKGMFSVASTDKRVRLFVQLNNKVLLFENFSLVKEFPMSLEVILHQINDGFLGEVKQSLGTTGALLYRIKPDFSLISILTVESVMSEIMNDLNIQEWVASESEKDTGNPYLDLNFYVLSIQVLNPLKGLILIRSKLLEGSVLIVIQLVNNEKSFQTIIPIKEGLAFSIDSLREDERLFLYVGLLDTKRNETVFIHYELEKGTVIDKKIIERERTKSEEYLTRDIEDIMVESKNRVFMKQNKNLLLRYTFQDGKFDLLKMQNKEYICTMNLFAIRQ